MGSDAAIADWTRPRTVEDVLQALNAASVPGGKVYTAKDIAEDPHFRARGLIERTETANGLALGVPGVVPKLSLTPGRAQGSAPRLGEHTEEVLARLGKPAPRAAPDA